MRTLALSILVLLLGACAAETSSPAVADHFEVVSGEDQTGRLHGTLTAPIVVRLLDERGRPMPGHFVDAYPSDPDAVVALAADTTDGDGLVTLWWTLGSQLGAQSLHVRTQEEVAVTVGAESTGLILDALASGFFFGCGLDPAQRAWCWGENWSRRLGSDDLSATGPIRIGGDSLQFVELAAGDLHACGRTAGGAVYCWGANSRGQLGNGRAGTTSEQSSTPVRVAGLPAVHAFDAARNATCALTTSDELWCWGSGAGLPQSDLALPVFGGATFRAIALGGTHGCAITTGGVVECWGNDTSGQLGNGPGATSSVTPQPLARALSADRLVSGETGSCALEVSGALYCWGYISGLRSRERDSLGADYPARIDETGPVRGVSLGWYCGAIWGPVGAPRFLCGGFSSDIESNGAPYRQVEFGSESLCVLTAQRTVYCKSYSDSPSPPYYGYAASGVPAP